MRSTLTLTRTGSASQVFSWLRSDKLSSVSDCRFSYYGSSPPPTDTLCAVDHHFVGGKWAGIYDFFQQHPGLIDQYDYFWFPDDDIETTAEDAIRFLEIVREEGFSLAQPALRPDSYYAYHTTLANPRFRFRRTNFVELMMPIIRRDLLKAVLPLFKDRHAAMGLDLFWHQLTENPDRDVAIIDAVAMGHYRPRQTHLKGRMSAMKVDILAERDRTMREFSVQSQPPITLSGVTKEGWRLKRGLVLWLFYLLGLIQIRKETTRRPLSYRAMRKHMKSQWDFRGDFPCFDRQAYDRFMSAYNSTN